MTRAVVFDSETPDIIELRKEFKEKFGELIHKKAKASMVVIDENQENAYPDFSQSQEGARGAEGIPELSDV